MSKQLTILLLFAIIGLNGNAQSASPLSTKRKNVLITYQYGFGTEGKMTTMGDTLLIRGDLVLEPIKVNGKLNAYCLTDLNRKKGLRFEVKGQSTPAGITVYAMHQKSEGMMMPQNASVDQNKVDLSAFIKSRNIVVNGANCTEYVSKKTIPMSLVKTADKIVSTRIIINNSLKDQKYPFINPDLASHFGGAIMLLESTYDSGRIVSTKFDYTTNIPANYNKVFDKYQKLFNANLALLN